jgi:hypothetical protein
VGELDALPDALFERSDLLHGGVEEIEFLFQAATGLRREFLEGSIEPGSAFPHEDVGMLGSIEGILSEGGVNAVLESGTRLRECHTGSVKFSFVADLARRQPDSREASQVNQGGEPFGIELIGLVDIAHDDLGFRSVGQEWNASSLFDLIDDPVVVADGFEGDGSSFGKYGKKVLDSAGIVIDPRLFNG